MSLLRRMMRMGLLGGQGFSPRDISGLSAWYDASQIAGLADGAAVSSLTDLVGANHAVNTLTARPVYKVNILNGKPVVRFAAASSQFLRSAGGAPAINQPTTVFVVGKAGADNQALFDSGTQAAKQLIDRTATNTFRIFAGSVLNVPVTGDAAYHIFCGVFNGATSIAAADGKESAAGAAGATTLAGITLGARGGVAAQFLDGDIAEVLVYGAALSLADRLRVLRYLADKWSLLRVNIIFDGDSLTAGFGASEGQDYASQLLAALRTTYTTPGVRSLNTAANGQTSAHCLQFVSEVTPQSFIRWTKNLVVLWAGTNDIEAGSAAADIYANLTAYTAACKAVGFSVALLTTIKRGPFPAPKEAVRVALNALILANAGGADIVIDVASNAAFSNPADATYYNADQIHLTDAGYGVVAEVVGAAI